VPVCLTLLAGGCGGDPADQATSANAAVPAPKAEQTAAPRPLPDLVRVRLETEAGPMLLELDAKRAPVTAANFLRYAREGRFDGTSFYRAAPTKGQPGRGFIQGGIRRDYKRMLPAIEHEPTAKSGIRHERGTISMARAEDGAGAMGDFFITLSRMPAMDAGPGRPGFAAFGRVVDGIEVAEAILAAPRVENAGRGAMRGQMLEKPVRILKARVEQ
jgi:peptidyl-prolyl cis-trans isomerase A (cyclophilin A)